MVSSVREAEWSAWIERLVGNSAPDGSPAELPRSRFYCRLDDQPDHLVPQRYLRSQTLQAPPDRPLFVNPYSQFTKNEEVPRELNGVSSLLANFALPGDMVWIRNHANGWLPFWLGSRLAA